jgi:hypothetical protein
VARPLILAREANVIRVAFDEPGPPTPRFPGAAGARVPAFETQTVAAIAPAAERAPAQQHCA